MLEERYMTVEEAARYLRVGMNRMYQLCKQPDFPSFKIGQRHIIDKEQLDAVWIRNRQQTTK